MRNRHQVEESDRASQWEGQKFQKGEFANARPYQAPSLSVHLQWLPTDFRIIPKIFSRWNKTLSNLAPLCLGNFTSHPPLQSFYSVPTLWCICAHRLDLILCCPNSPHSPFFWLRKAALPPLLGFRSTLNMLLILYHTVLSLFTSLKPTQMWAGLLRSQPTILPDTKLTLKYLLNMQLLKHPYFG